MKLICAADLHLGRIPSRLPADLDPRSLSAAVAWHALVDRAVQERADALLLAGDVVDDDGDFFEAYADLRRGTARLLEAGVRVIAVSGNHDVEVLPRLADELPGLTLLGRDGRWEVAPLQAGGEAVRVAGWSFPRRRVTGSPFEGFREAVAAADAGSGPLVGLLHGDRDATDSPYAPFRAGDLIDHAADAWLLGHVHRPDALDPHAPRGYLGSLAASDPGEEGLRGAWRLRVEGAELAMERLPLAPLRYETVEVPVDDLERAEGVGGAILRALRATHERLAPESDGLRVVAARLRIVGRTPLGDALRGALAADADPRGTIQEVGGVRYLVHDVRVETRPAVDLAALARGDDPPAVVARVLLALDDPTSPERARLIRDARPVWTEVLERRAFTALPAAAPSDDDVAERLRAVALRSLDALLAARGGPAA